MVQCDLAAQWGGYPWDIDLTTLPAAWPARSIAYANLQAQREAAASRKQHLTHGSRRTFGG